MTDTQKDAASQRDRSPAFPVIPLETALNRLIEFQAHYKRTTARPDKIGEAWEIKAKGYADRVAAALRYFGLLEYRGTGKDRNIVISESGLKYLRAQQPELKGQIAKEVALRPKQIAKHWNEWGADRPAYPACLDALMNEGFSEGGARDFLKVYDATITYAKLSDSDKAAVIEASESEAEGQPMQPVASETTVKSGVSHRSMTMHERFALDEGEVTLSYPAELSPESYQDMADRIEIVLRGLKRRADAEAARRRIEREDFSDE
jgi:hypothetical protein